MTTLELLKGYLNAYFVEHDPGKILDMVTDDIHCYGFADDVVIENREQAAAMVASPGYQKFMDYSANVLEEKQLSDEAAQLLYSLTWHNVSVSYRLTGGSKMTPEGRKLYLLHFSMLNPRRTLNMYNDIERHRKEEKRRDIEREVLQSAMPGGIIGAYVEDGFPFMCINDTMLKYMGYAGEQEFVDSIGGNISNCIHPDDAQQVYDGIMEQLDSEKEFQMDYRMRKKDGSYIWVHENGRRIDTDDGRVAVISACCDITTEREHMNLLNSIINNSTGGIALYRVEEDWRMTLMYAGSGVSRLGGLNEREYAKLCGDDAMDTIFIDDRRAVMDAIREAIEHDTVKSLTYRVPQRDGSYAWINGFFSRFGDKNGRPILRAVYTPASVQYDVQMQALSQSGTGVCIMDMQTNELYYANDAAFALHGAKPCDYTGKTCCEAFYGHSQTCESCWRSKMKNGEGQTVTRCGERTLSVTAEARRWNNRDVVVIYQQDISGHEKLRRAAEESNRELMQMLHNMSCGMCVCAMGRDNSFSIKYISDGFCELFEGTHDELMGRFSENHAGGIHPDDMPAVAEFVGKCKAGPCRDEITYRYTTVKGSRIWITLKVVVVPDGDGLTCYATYFDVTERMRAQKHMSDVVHNVPGGVCMYKWNGQSLEPMVVSEQVARLFGLDISVVEKHISTFDYGTIHKDDVEGVTSTILKSVDNPGKTYSFTYRIWNADMQCYRWVSTSGICVAQDDGEKIIYVNYADVNEAKEMEQRLRQEEEMLQAACDFAGMWGWVYEISADRAQCFNKLRRDFDLPEYLENYPESWLERGFIQPESVELYRDSVNAIKRGSMGEEFDCRIHYKDGTLHWVRIRMNRLGENADAAICTSQVIDGEKYMEARIELEEKQQSDGSANLLAHFITNVSQNRPMEHSYHFNERAELLEWRSIEEQLKRTAEYIVYTEKRAEFKHMHDSAYLAEQFACGRTSESMEYRRTLPDGNIIWVRTVIHLVQEPRTGDILNYEYLYDINQQKVIEEIMSGVLAYGFERCASLMMDSDQITTLHSGGGHAENSMDVVRFSEYNAEYVKDMLPEDRDAYLETFSPEGIAERFKHADRFEMVYRMQESGGLRYKKVQCFNYVHSHSICLLIRSDITETVMQEQEKQDKLQKALEAAEAATLAKSEFLSRMSHEIRTPMNAIMGMTAIAKDSSSDFKQVVECLDKIDMSSHFLLTLINDILEMSRIESGNTEIKHSEFNFDVMIESIRTVVEPLALRSSIRYDFINNAKTDSHYRGDAMRIQQVIVNIISNAIKFTKPGGRVRFSVNTASETKTHTTLKFVVADTGIGMSEAFMKKMFQPFTQEDGSNTSKFGGSGLGLAISKSLVEAMGGSIEVDSFVGIGSTFTVSLPLDRVVYAVHDEPVTEARPDNDFSVLNGCHVLMAEDHPLNVMVARKLLERRDIIVTVVENGRLAVEKFDDSVLNYFDAILMDIRMPVMDGLSATMAIRSLDRPDARTVPIIAMTANALDEDRRRSGEAGMNAHLAKPFEPVQLYRTLAEQIGKAGGR